MDLIHSLATHETMTKVPRLKYNDMVLTKWMLTLFIQHQKAHSTMKIKVEESGMNWLLMNELLDQEFLVYKEGNRDSIETLIAEFAPQIGLDTFVVFQQLSRPAILVGCAIIDKASNNPAPLTRIVSEYLDRYPLTKYYYGAFPDWWLED